MLRTLKNYGHLVLAIVANLFYGFPAHSLKVIAITGTDGKTTSSTLLYHVVASAGKKVGLISTVAAYIGDEQIDTGFHVTSPSPFALMRLFVRMKNAGMEYVILEVTSHGIDQYRIYGIKPLFSGITNVTHEHLDYHKTFTKYLETKAQLLLLSETAFINENAEDSFGLLQDCMVKNNQDTVIYSVGRLSKKLINSAKQRFGHQDYNYQNVALVSAIADRLNIKDAEIAKAITTFPGVPGRMEEVISKKGIKVIVDFAHTPNALEQALLAVRLPANQKTLGMKKGNTSSGRVIVVFGCAGLRDHSKRPLMGAIAARLADIVILTAEDPRTEDVWSIIHQIKSGIITGQDKVITIPDRYESIKYALLSLAKPKDTVIITGKGHEQSMCFGEIETPWSDQKAVLEISESL